MLTVMNTADSGPGSLRDTIAAASPGDTIVFDPSLDGQVITLSSELAITKSLNIAGPGASQLTISGNNATRVMDISGGPAVIISGLTIADSLANVPLTIGSLTLDVGGGILNRGGAVTVSNVTLSDNNAMDPTATVSLAGGGGIANLGSGSTLIVTNSTLQGDSVFSAAGAGGAIVNLFGGYVQISGSLFDANDQATGYLIGVGGAVASDGASTLVVDQTTFGDNDVGAQLGAGTNPLQGMGAGADIWNGGGGRALVSRSSFEGALAIGGGDTFPTTVNGGAGLGGAICNTADSLVSFAAPSAFTVLSSFFAGNEVDGGDGTGTGGVAAGGALYNASSYLNVDGCTFTSNNFVLGGISSTGPGGFAAGGAIASTFAATISTPGHVRVSNSTLTDNNAFGGISFVSSGGGAAGGAIWNSGGSSLTVIDCQVSGNAVEGGNLFEGTPGFGDGGGIFNDSGSRTALHDCVITNNDAEGGLGFGGGVFNSSTGALSIDALTMIFSNTATTAGPNIYGPFSMVP
jgi:hypothetical protein